MVLSIILMVLMMIKFTNKILAWLKMFYKEDEQKSRNVFIMQKVWVEIYVVLETRLQEFSNRILYVRF